jgi:hypothetical protein
LAATAPSIGAVTTALAFRLTLASSRLPSLSSEETPPVVDPPPVVSPVVPVVPVVPVGLLPVLAL